MDTLQNEARKRTGINTEDVIRQFQEWYGLQEGMKVYLTVMPGIMADFNRMLDERPGELITEEYRLEDGKGAVILTGWKKSDGGRQISLHF